MRRTAGGTVVSLAGPGPAHSTLLTLTGPVHPRTVVVVDTRLDTRSQCIGAAHQSAVIDACVRLRRPAVQASACNSTTTSVAFRMSFSRNLKELYHFSVTSSDPNYATRRPASADRTARAANFRRDLEAT